MLSLTSPRKGEVGTRSVPGGGHCSDHFGNALANGVKIFVHLDIPEADDANAVEAQKTGSPLIIALLFRVLIEIENVWANGVLPPKRDAKPRIAQGIPQLRLRFRGIPA